MYTYDVPRYRQKPTIWQQLHAGIVRPVLRSGRHFCLETSFHGLKQIAVPGRHWLERFLWMGVIAICVWGAVDVSLGQWQRYNESPTVVTLEKNFRTWRFSLPALTSCAKNRVNPSKMRQVIKDYWKSDPHDERYEYYSKFVNVVASSDLFHLEGYQEFRDDEELNVDLLQLTVDVMYEHQIKTKSSENWDFQWIPVMTEAGICYVTNCLAITDVAIQKLNPNVTKAFPITCKYSSLTCYVMMEILNDSNFYVHSPYDVADIASPPSRVYLTLNRITELSVMETGTGRGVKALIPRRRGCLYTDEPTSSTRQVYSTSTCRQSCRSRLAVKLCDCRPFYYFYEEGSPCTPAGMHCLAGHAQLLASTSGVRCTCSPQCVDCVYREIANIDQFWDRGPFSNRGAVKFTVQAPRTRYTREIVFHFQDLVVSFGGAAGLFLGASFISFVEIIYFLLERIFWAVSIHNEEVIEKPAKRVKKPSVMFEMKRVAKLNSMLDSQRRYSYDFNMKMHHY